MRIAAEAALPTEQGEFRLVGFGDILTRAEHVVLGDVSDQGGRLVLVRVLSECLTGDALHSLRCDCGEQRDAAMQTISDEGRGVLVYLRQEGRGICLLNKVRAYALQDGEADTVEANLALGFPADVRDFGVGDQMLALLGVIGLNGFGLGITGRVPLHAGPRLTHVIHLWFCNHSVRLVDAAGQMPQQNRVHLGRPEAVFRQKIGVAYHQHGSACG